LCWMVLLCAGRAIAQNAAFPLESVAIEGSVIPQPVVLEIAGLRIAAPIDKARIDEACRRLQESGLFGSISYRCTPGPKNGYLLTFILADQAPLQAAVIDIPGVDESEPWQWLATKFRRFDHQVPQVDSAQNYLAGELERHLGGRMRGQHIAVRMETDLKTRKVSVMFQPDILPKLQAVSFSGNGAVSSQELAAVLNPLAINKDFTERRLTSLVEMNLRPVYEQHGYYRVKFVPGTPQFSDAGASVAVAITEGALFQLGRVDLVGADLPIESMMSAAKFPTGKLANWKQIQDGIWEMEKVVKRTGFFEATATPDRLLDDAAHTLDLRIRVSKGPLYHFGDLSVTGLSSNLEARARQLWKAKPGDPYDYMYSVDFLREFSRAIDFRMFRKYDAQTKRGPGDHVMDINLIFEMK